MSERKGGTFLVLPQAPNVYKSGSDHKASKGPTESHQKGSPVLTKNIRAHWGFKIVYRSINRLTRAPRSSSFSLKNEYYPPRSLFLLQNNQARYDKRLIYKWIQVTLHVFWASVFPYDWSVLQPSRVPSRCGFKILSSLFRFLNPCKMRWSPIL